MCCFDDDNLILRTNLMIGPAGSWNNGLVDGYGYAFWQSLEYNSQHLLHIARVCNLVNLLIYGDFHSVSKISTLGMAPLHGGKKK
ncbi:hypothetical protein SAMN05421821_10134 [Mucilaginibacter lappiensis]|nr:hypothetical protein SAMN05421821_10134 [Mucilaginibacter lappiensis]